MMKLDSLTLLHLPKHAAKEAENPFHGRDGFVLESCLRWIMLERGTIAQGSPPSYPEGTEAYHGEAAYRFLLEIACGLHSKIQGESEIFGQIKQAWKAYSEAQPLTSQAFHRLMQNLFADTKRIRTQHLHGIGGQSYPSAIQKLLNLRKDQHLLIIGAGQFGAMLASKLKNKVASLIVMNRSPSPLVTQAGWEGLETQIAQATHVLIAIPTGKDAALEARIQAAWRHKRHGKLLHLAQMDFSHTAWESLPHFIGLAEVMNLQNAQQQVRPHAIAEAFAAIAQAAQSRNTPSPLLLRHQQRVA
jgi:hypothetical protein